MTASLASLQIGRVITAGDPASRDLLQRRWTTGFYKQPVSGPVQLTRLGIEGDAVGDTKNHGGTEKAALCYALSHYAIWRAEHPQLRFGPGGMAENLTIDGADESSICVGDRFRIGDSLVEVSQPRQPCWKISRRWGLKTLTKEVTQTGRTGWYLRVIEEGTIESGQSIELIARPHEAWSIARLNDLMFGREVDRMALFDLMNLRELSDQWKQDIS